MKHRHALLVRQMKAHLAKAPLSPEMEGFLNAVEKAYTEYDEKCAGLENSLKTTEQQLLETASELRDALEDMTERVRVRTKLHSEVNERLIKEIAERKRAEKKYRGLFENSVGGIFQSTLDGILLNANAAMAQLLGYDSPDDLIASLTDIRTQLYVHPEDRDRYVQLLLNQGRITGFEAQFRRKDGTTTWGRVSCVLIVDESGRPSHIEGACENISQYKEFEQGLQKAKEEAEELSQLKSNLLSMVSHELRTPLTSILGYSKIIHKQFSRLLSQFEELAESDIACNRIKDNLKIITSEGQRLTDLINDVLDLAKLESGGMEWNDQDIPVDLILGHAIQATQVLFRGPGPKLKQEIPSALPMVRGDRDRLIQVCINLLSNAAKFTEKGTVICRATCDTDMMCISVVDTGRGIGDMEKDIVFSKFKQLDDTLTGRPRGTGLGLAICKEIVERHGGQIWVESQPDQGSTFHFTVPVVR